MTDLATCAPRSPSLRFLWHCIINQKRRQPKANAKAKLEKEAYYLVRTKFYHTVRRAARCEDDSAAATFAASATCSPWWQGLASPARSSSAQDLRRAGSIFCKQPGLCAAQHAHGSLTAAQAQQLGRTHPRPRVMAEVALGCHLAQEEPDIIQPPGGCMGEPPAQGCSSSAGPPSKGGQTCLYSCQARSAQSLEASPHLHHLSNSPRSSPR